MFKSQQLRKKRKRRALLQQKVRGLGKRVGAWVQGMYTRPGFARQVFALIDKKEPS